MTSSCSAGQEAAQRLSLAVMGKNVFLTTAAWLCVTAAFSVGVLEKNTH